MQSWSEPSRLRRERWNRQDGINRTAMLLCRDMEEANDDEVKSFA